MPLIGTDFTDEQGLDPNQNNHGPGTYAPPATTGSSGFLGGSSGQGKTTTAAGDSTAATSSGSNYTNLTDYLNANQGAGSTMGQAVSGVAQGVGQQTSQDTGAYKQAGVGEAQVGTKSVDQNTLSGLQGRDVDPSEMAKIKNGITTGQATTTVNPDGSQTITGGRQSYGGPLSESKLNEKMTAPDASYSGPSDRSHLSQGTAGLQSQAYGDLTRLAGYGSQASGGQAGNAALLKGVYTQPSYTAGENGFDAAVLGGTAGGQAGIKSIQDATTTGKKTVSDSDTAVDSAIQGGKDTSAATATTYGNAVTAGNARNAATNKAYQDAISQMRAQALAYNPTVTQVAAPVAAPSDAGGASSALPSIAGPATPTLPGGGSLPTIDGPAIPTVPSINTGTPINATAPAQVVEGAASRGADWAHKHGFADGGEVEPDGFSDFKADDSKDSGGGVLAKAGKLAPLVMMLMNHGGPVPGKSKFPGNNKKNDVVPAMLSKGEIVLPNTVTQSENAPDEAKEFVAKVQSPEHRFSALLDYMRKAK